MYHPESPAARALEELEHQFQALAECSADAIFITDFDSACFLKVNPRASALFGYPAGELRGMTGRQLHPPEDRAVVDAISRDLIRDGTVVRHAVRLQRKDGGLFWAELRSSVYHARGRKLYVTFVRDISGKLLRERELNQAYETLKDTEEQLVRSSRLAAIGQLAAGVAHEVNNPAAGALMNLEVLGRDIAALSALAERADVQAATDPLYAAVRELSRDAEAAVRDSAEAVQRIVSIVRGLRGFAQICEDEVELVRINDTVDAALRLLSHQLRQHAVVRCELASKRSLVADRGKLIQVFINLLLNAVHAIEVGGGTTIKVQTRDSGDGVFVRIEDDGPGIDPAVAPHVFEPFFTTKREARSTGLGLSLSADIVHRHRGRLELCKVSGRGACFELFLPIATGLELSPARRVASEPVRGRILVVDDDATLVRAYRRWLGRTHEVVVAYDGDEALAVLERDDAFDVVLCDLMMPRFDGVALYEEVLQRLPHLSERFVFCSGGTTTRRYQDFAQRQCITLFDKPLPRDRFEHWLAERIRAGRA